MAHLSVCLLGPFEVTLDGESVTGFESDRVRALLAYLVVEADRPHRRDMLAGLLWSEWPDQAARTNLRNALVNLRHAIGDATFGVTSDGRTLTLKTQSRKEHVVSASTFRVLRLKGPK